MTTIKNYADFCRDLALGCFYRRRRYTIGSIERVLCVEASRWHIAGYRSAVRSAANLPPGDREATPKANSSEAERRRAFLYLSHPDAEPGVVDDINYLIHPPGRLSPTARFIEFRDGTLARLITKNPQDKNFPRYAAAVQIILDWRADVATEDRFWKPDPQQ